MIIRTVRSVTEWVCACTIFMSGGGRVGPYKVGGGVESWGGYVQHVIQVTVLNNAYGALILFKRCHVTGHNVHLTGVTRAVAPQVRAHTHTHTYMLLAVSLIHSRIAGNTHTLQAGMHTLRKVTHISCSTQALQVPRTHCRDHAYIAGAMHALQAGMHTLREVTHIAGTRHAYHGPAWYTLQAVIHTLQAVRNIWQEVIHFAGTTRKLITGISLF